MRSDGSRRTWRLSLLLLLLLLLFVALSFVRLCSTNAEGCVLVFSLISIKGSSLSTLDVDSVQNGGVVEKLGLRWSGTSPAGLSGRNRRRRAGDTSGHFCKRLTW